MSKPLPRIALLCLLSVFFSMARAQSNAPASASSTAPAAGKTLIVGVKVAPPFVIEKNGKYSGLAIDLWQDAAKDHGWKFTYKKYDLEGLLNAVSSDQVAVGLGAITATAERERRMDFSHLLTSSGLGIAVRNHQTAGWLAVVSALFSAAFLKVIGTLALLLLLVGLLMWFFERRQNEEQFGGTRRQGIFSGFWWAMVTMTTVGYGDTAPRTVPGRLVGMVWMLTALIIVSFFTASITSALTVGQLSQRVTSAKDLSSLKVTSLADSTSAQWLDGNHISFNKAANLDQALADLAADKTDAVVYDKPLLHYDIQQQFQGKLTVLPLVLARQDYAFALPTHSPLREAIDTSLLQRINSDQWNKRLEDYFGKESSP